MIEFEPQYKNFVQHAFDWEIWENELGEIINITPACEKVSGYRAEEFLRDRELFNSLVLDEDKDIWTNHRHEALSSKGISSLEFRIRHKNGSIIWIEHMCSPVFDQDGSYIGHIVNNRDITQKKSMELKVHKSEEKYRLLAENVSDVIWVYNVTRDEFTYVSQAIKGLLGYSPEEYLNFSLDDILVPKSLELIRHKIVHDSKVFVESMGKNNSDLSEIQQYRKDREIVWVETSVRFRYNDKEEIEILGLSRNIDERKQNEERILYLSYYDQLTGLYNRRFYEEELKRLDNSRSLPISLIVADINGLKLANDAFGHKVGDQLLKAFADILKRGSRSNDIVARIAGDEFAILLPNTSLGESKSIVNRIKNDLDKVYINNILLSASFGYCSKSNLNEDMAAVFAKAEDNMYKDKLAHSNELKKKTIDLIISNLFEKSPREEEHGKMVSQLCMGMGVALNLSVNRIENLAILGLFHDIGKINIDKDILNKRGSLNKNELYIIKRHPEVGYQIIRAINEYSHLAEYILSHHERIDGKGYPQGLKGESIPMEARILSIADAYDSMTNQNSYKNPISRDEAIEELRRHSGTQFDSDIVDLFINKVLNGEYAN
ncbi:MAG: HD domain-containing phosphohydrolase [Tissierellaceae bacterium]